LERAALENRRACEERVDRSAAWPEPRGSSIRHQETRKVFLIGREPTLAIQFSARESSGRLAEMGGVRAISNKIVEHRIDRRRHRRDFDEAGEDRAIADWGIDHKGRSLRYL
jgi:hypothetical protein